MRCDCSVIHVYEYYYYYYYYENLLPGNEKACRPCDKLAKYTPHFLHFKLLEASRAQKDLSLQLFKGITSLLLDTGQDVSAGTTVPRMSCASEKCK